MIFLFRLLLWRPSQPIAPYLIGALQDLWIASQLSFLPYKPLIFFLNLYQLIALIAGARASIRLAPSSFYSLKHPRSLIDSLRDLKLAPTFAFGLLFLYPIDISPYFLLALPLALYKGEELTSYNPLFYLQWKWFLLKKSLPASLPTFPDETSTLIDPAYPLFRKTYQRSSLKIIHHPPLEKPNILFIFLESFRYDSFNQTNTPYFHSLSQKGVLYTQFHAAGQQTFQSLLASLYGVQPSLETSHMSPYVKQPLYGLPDILKQEGYQTALIEGGFSTFSSNTHFFKNHSLDYLAGAEQLGGEKSGLSWGVHDEHVYAHALDWIKKQTSPYFASLFTITNHHPWKSPPNWPAIDHSIERKFLNTLAYTDHSLGQFVESLDLKNTLLFILGDHGQDLGEKQTHFAARGSLSQKNIHVPLLIYNETHFQPTTINTPCGAIDLLPTLLDLLNLPGPHHSIGKSLLRKRSGPLYFSLATIQPQYGCRNGDWKWISSSPEELYHLPSDPNELHNLAPQNPTLSTQLKNDTLRHFASIDQLYKTRSWAPPTPTHEPILRVTPQTTDATLALPSHIDSIDLYPAQKLTDHSLRAIGKKLGPSLRQFIAPNSPFITDQGMKQLLQQSPHLLLLKINGCPLITPTLIEYVLEHCTQLQSLDIDNLDSITTLRPNISTLSLTSLFLGETTLLDSPSIEHLLSKSPHLTHLELNLSHCSPSLLATHTSQLTHLTLFDFPGDSSQLDAILDANPLLWRLQITNAPRLTSLSLKHRLMRQLTLRNCPALKRLDTEGAPLDILNLESCPKLSNK